MVLAKKLLSQPRRSKLGQPCRRAALALQSMHGVGLLRVTFPLPTAAGSPAGRSQRRARCSWRRRKIAGPSSQRAARLTGAADGAAAAAFG